MLMGTYQDHLSLMHFKDWGQRGYALLNIQV